jgi:hypothetical protein
MNVTLTIERYFTERRGRAGWNRTVTTDEPATYNLGPIETNIAVNAIETSIEAVADMLARENVTGAALTVVVPDEITLTESLQTAIIDKFSADPTFASVAFGA